MSPDAGQHQRREDPAASASADAKGGPTLADGLLGVVLVVLWLILLSTSLIGLSEPLAGALGGSKKAGYVAAGAFELYAAALFLFAFIRRVQHGEAAYLTRFLAWTAAAAMAYINFSSHTAQEAVIFAAASLGAALLAALLEETMLRQELRRRNQLGPPLPVYPLGMHFRERAVLQRAKELAARDPELGLYGSIDAARQELAEEKREAEERARRADLEQLLLERFEKELGDPLKARIALAAFNMREVTSQIRDGVDNKALAERVVGEVAPKAPADVNHLQLPAGPELAPLTQGWPPIGEIHTKPVPHMAPASALPDPPTQSAAELPDAPESSMDVKALSSQSARGALHAVPSQSKTGGVHTPRAGKATVKGKGSQSGKKNTPPPEIVKAAETAASKVLGGGGSGADAARAYIKVVKDAGFDYSPTKVAAAADITRERVYQIARA